jgi:hypothetical protein
MSLIDHAKMEPRVNVISNHTKVQGQSNFRILQSESINLEQQMNFQMNF